MMVHSVCIGGPIFAGDFTPTVAVSTWVCRGGGGVWLDAMRKKPISQVPIAQKYVLHTLMHIFKYRSCEIDPHIIDFWYRICAVATSRGGRQFVTPRAVA